MAAYGESPQGGHGTSNLHPQGKHIAGQSISSTAERSSYSIQASIDQRWQTGRPAASGWPVDLARSLNKSAMGVPESTGTVIRLSAMHHRIAQSRKSQVESGLQQGSKTHTEKH